jgi:hypothetical protein
MDAEYDQIHDQGSVEEGCSSEPQAGDRLESPAGRVELAAVS